MLNPAMRYAPYAELAEVPNVIVDGSGTPATVLVLSHWPHSGTPERWRADLSAEIAFRFLDDPIDVGTDAVSNNHFDLDGLISVLALTEPDAAVARRELLEAVARVGDFARGHLRDATRAAAALGAWADPERSPLPAATFEGDYPHQTAALYGELLGRTLDIVDHVDRHRELWGKDDACLAATEAALASGAIEIEERPELDLAVVVVHDDGLGRQQFSGGASAGWHPVPVHNATDAVRLLVVHGRRYELRDRYEGWVQLASRRVARRVDLRPLADELAAAEPGAARWRADPPERITPVLQLDDDDESGLDRDRVEAIVEHHLRTAPPAWDPYD